MAEIASSVLASLPDPGGARTLDEFVEKLRLLRVRAGSPSYGAIKDRVNASWAKAGRRGELTKKGDGGGLFQDRLNTDLLLEVPLEVSQRSSPRSGLVRIPLLTLFVAFAGLLSSWILVSANRQAGGSSTAEFRAGSMITIGGAFRVRGEHLDGGARMFGRLVRSHRQRLGLTQNELADRAGISERSVRNLEAGRIRSPRPETVRLLADAFGLTGSVRDRFCQLGAGAPTGQPDSAAVPAQLPPDLPWFTGRKAQLAELDALLTQQNGRLPTAVTIATVSGTAGVGKTSLAVHWAHRVADRFPDGQLYVDLRGFGPNGQDKSPAEAIRGFLDALDVPGDQIPHDLDAQIGLYRSRLAGRRMLVIIDNARDAEQVRPLLPGAGTAMAVVTSRNQLTGLTAKEGAHPIRLALLSAEEALQLLADRLGRDQVAAESGAIDAIIAACGRLPLALVVASAHALQTGFPLAVVAAELADPSRRLDTLDAGDPASGIRSVFSWSYTGLSASAARLFRLLGLHPGPDISAAAAASLAGSPPVEVRQPLADLVRATLLAEQQPGRYAMHDLLHVFASELADRIEPAPERGRALTRLLCHYTHTANQAERLCEAVHSPMEIPLTAVPAGCYPEHLSDRHDAIRWLTAERPTLVTAVPYAAEHGFHTYAWQLAWSVHSFLWVRGYRRDLPPIWRAALTAAQQCGDLYAQAHAHRALAQSESVFGHYDEAQTHYRHTLDLYGQVGDTVRQADTYRYIAHLHGNQGDLDQALSNAMKGLSLFRTTNHVRGLAIALTVVGWFHALRGDHTQAIVHSEEALKLHQQLDDQLAEANTWDTLGLVNQQLGRYDEAEDCYRRAVTLFDGLANPTEGAESLERLGDVYHAVGNLDAARDAWLRALHAFLEFDHKRIDAVRGKLRR